MHVLYHLRPCAHHGGLQVATPTPGHPPPRPPPPSHAPAPVAVAASLCAPAAPAFLRPVTTGRTPHPTASSAVGQGPAAHASPVKTHPGPPALPALHARPAARCTATGGSRSPLLLPPLHPSLHLVPLPPLQQSLRLLPLPQLQQSLHRLPLPPLHPRLRLLPLPPLHLSLHPFPSSPPLHPRVHLVPLPSCTRACASCPCRRYIRACASCPCRHSTRACTRSCPVHRCAKFGREGCRGQPQRNGQDFTQLPVQWLLRAGQPYLRALHLRLRTKRHTRPEQLH